MAKNEMAAKELGNRLTALRDAHPCTFGDIMLFTYARFEVKLSAENIRKAHEGLVDPTSCNVKLLTAMLAFYEVEPEALGHFAAHEINKTMAMASAQTGSGPTHPGDGSLDGPTGTPDHANGTFGWTPVLAGQATPIRKRAVPAEVAPLRRKQAA